jgi:hypothetical protein
MEDGTAVQNSSALWKHKITKLDRKNLSESSEIGEERKLKGVT